MPRFTVMKSFAAAACALLIATGAAWAQEARVLDDNDLRSTFTRAGHLARVKMTGGVRGRKYDIKLHSDGKLELSIAGGPNVGRDWKVDTGALCLRGYASTWGGAFNCGRVELRGGRLSWIDEESGVANWIDEVKFEKS